MFHIDATFEDCRITASAPDGVTPWTVTINDSWKGDSRKILHLTHQQLSYILQFNLDPSGEPEGYEKMYEVLEPIFKGWPNNLRPIP